MTPASRQLLTALAILIPWIGLSVFIQSSGPFQKDASNLIFFILIGYTFLLLLKLMQNANAGIHSLANLVRALRHGDYTQRASTGCGPGAWGVLQEEINLLADALQQNRLARMEDDFLLQNLIDKLEIAALVLDGNHRLLMVNTAFVSLFDKPAKELLGLRTDEIGLNLPMEKERENTIWLNLPRRSSRFIIHRTEFRRAGKARLLLLMTDLRNPLREEERTAWKRLIRVIGHELNNSLTPIISLARSVKGRVQQIVPNETQAKSIVEALEVIDSRAMHLNHFMQDYSRLAKLPEPRREAVPLSALLQRVSGLENSSRIDFTSGPECTLNVDPAQVENLFINLIKNAFDAMDKSENARISISWRRQATEVTVWIDDNGPGFEASENLFVPFFSTKPEGSGIGLVLSRQIAEANGGSLELENRKEGGCRASVVLPLRVSN